MLLAQIPVFNPKSDQAKSISDLFIVTLAIGAGIILLVTVLVLIVMVKFRRNNDEEPGSEKSEPEQIHGSRRWEIGWTVAPAVLLAVLFIPTLIVMGNSDPAVSATQNRQPDLVIVGHQFWWEYRYPKDGFVTANDLHLPVGQQVLTELESGDVIHDFWVPELGRKMDAIPGKSNYIWLQANQTGLFNGACSEYCGAEHAWMLIKAQVVNGTDFEAWKQAQKQIPAAPAPGSQAEQGKLLFDRYSCSSCHTITGTNANAKIGPDLTHIATRPVLGSGILPNSLENLTRWVRDAPAIKPGVKMPGYTQLRDDELQPLVAYLESLK